MPALMNAAVAARLFLRLKNIPPITANAEVTATSNQRCTWGEMGLGARSKISTVFSGSKFMNLSSVGKDASPQMAVGIARRAISQIGKEASLFGERQDAAICVTQSGWQKISTQSSQIRTTINIPYTF